MTQHIVTPLDLPQNQEIAAAIAAGAAERKQLEVPVDRRNPDNVRQQLFGLQERLATYESNLLTHDRSEVEVLGKISALKKAKKKHEQAAVKNPRIADLLQTVGQKLAEAERELQDVKNDQDHQKRLVAETKQNIDDFLKESPRGGFISNRELLEDYEAQEETERELKSTLRR
jgi:hypothetical protein